MLNSWVYDDLDWWINEIHQACSQVQYLPCDATFVAPRGSVSREEWLEQLCSFYSSTLSLLKCKDLEIQSAQNLLFRAKALKKWRIADPRYAQARSRKAITGFLDRNCCASSAPEIPYPYDKFMRRVLQSWLPEPEKLGWRWTGRFGPGAVAEHYRHPKRFELLFEWCTQHTWPEIPLVGYTDDHNVARLCAVPKDLNKDRLITVEPCAGSFGQAYAREAIQCSVHAGPLKGSAMDLYASDGQEIQRRLALKASRTGRFATLDLSDASDNITYDQVCQVFPPWVCALLDATRTEYVADPENPKPHRLYIYAGMGNGTTFMVETLFFAAFVVSYALAHNLPRFVSVFGDDIICRSETAQQLMGESFSFFRVNKTKSFLAADLLRESCGIFAYKGADITVPKVDGYPPNWEGRLGLVDLHRRLYQMGGRCFQRLSYGIASTGLLVNWSKTFDGYPSISDERVEYSAAPLTRWNRNYQRLEAYLPIRRMVLKHYTHDWKVARKYNLPDPSVWLTATLSELVGAGDVSITGRSHRQPSRTSFPTGKMKLTRNWIPCIQPFYGK